MTLPSIQSAFVAGELAPGLWGHVDFNRMSIGAATMRNFYVGFKGGAYSRAGTSFVGYSKQTVENFATGSIFFSANPTAGQNIRLNGVVFTFVAAGATPSNYQFNIGGNAGGTIALAIVMLTTSGTYLANSALNVATYSDTGGGATDSLVVTYNTPGAAGNSYTLAASAATVSGPTLTNGGNYPPRLITFQFNLNQGLVLEFGHKYMRVISMGAFVTETPLSITGASQASPCRLKVGSTAGLANGDWMFVSGVQGMTQLNGRTFVIAVVDATHINLFDVFNAPINSTAYGVYTAGGTVARLYTLATPYGAADLEFIKFTQSADVMSLVCRNQQTGTEYAPYELSRTADDNWTLALFSTASSISAPTNVAGAATVTASVTGMTDYQYEVTAVDGTTGQESVASNIANIPNSVDISATAGSIVLNWTPVQTAGFYNIYKAPPAYMSTVPEGSLFGFAGSSFGASFVDSNIIQDMTQVPPLHKNPFARGQAISITILTPGAALIGPVGFFITTSTGSGATGYGVVLNGLMVSWVWTSGGQNYQPSDTIAFYDAGGLIASGNIVWAGNPSNGDTFTLNGKTFTWVNDGSGAPTNTTNYKINIGGNLAGSMFFALTALRTSPTYLADTSLNIATYTPDPNFAVDRIIITYNVPGTIGNAYTLATVGSGTRSAATLTGGTGGTAPTGTLHVGPESGTYPSVVAYFQERRAYANTLNEPDTYFMSQPGQFNNFDSRIPTLDTDAITGAPWSVQVDGIQFMIPLLGGMIMLTGQTAYQVTGSGGSPSNPQPITPSSQQALPQAYNGCHFHVAPVLIDYDIYYLQAKGSVIRSLSYNFWINVFTGIDITYLSSHLFTGRQINTMSWCEEPYKVMWCCRDDGVLLGLTSLKTQDVMGWTRHDTQGLFVGSTAVTEPPVDALYLATQRFTPDAKNPFMIERMDNRIWDSVEDVWCVDAGLTLPVSEPVGTLTVSSAFGLGAPVSYQNLVGGANYSQQTTATIMDPTGTGASVALTISNGAVLAVTFTGGTGYTAPQVQLQDPTSQGSGFSVTVVLNNAVALTADAAVWAPGNVGSVVRAGGGLMQITAYTSATAVAAAMIQPITEVVPNTDNQVPPFPVGFWTMAAQVTTITGLNHLAGFQVTGTADGNVIAPRTVAADGSITLDAPASIVTVGLAFRAQLQSLYLDGGVPTVQGRRKQIGAVTVRVEASGSFQGGANQPDGSTFSPQRVQTTWTSLSDVDTDSTGLAQLPYRGAGVLNSVVTSPVPLFTGDIRFLPSSGFEKPGQIAVQQLSPLPLNILAFIREIDLGDLPETDPKPSKAPDGYRGKK